MNIYFISYTTNPKRINSNQIQIKTIQCRETLKSYCWLGTRLPKYRVNYINSPSYNSSNVSLWGYATSLDILDTFKKQVQMTLIQCQKNLQKELELAKGNLQTFINNYQDQNIDPNTIYRDKTYWHEQYDFDDECEDDDEDDFDDYESKND